MAKKYTRQQLEQMAINAANKYGVPADLFLAQINHESGFNPNAKSKAGAQGIAQIMPATAKSWGVKDPFNPKEALDAAAKNMASYAKTYGGDWDKALAAYNAGVGAVAKYKGIPPYKETQNYVKAINRGRKSYATALATNNGTTNRQVYSLKDIATGGQKPMMNNGSITGAASGIQLPQTVVNQLQTNPTSAQELEKLLRAAQEGDTKAFERLKEVSEKAMSRYDTPVQVGTNPDTNEPIMMSPRQMDMLRQQEINQGLNAARQQALDVINPYTPEAQDYNRSMYNRLNNYYQQQLNAINAANPTGYQGLTPEQVRMNAQRQAGLNEFAAAFSGDPAVYAQAIANRNQNQLQADQLAYQQMIANQVGMPYEQYIAMKKAEAAAAQNMVEQTRNLAQYDMSRLGTSATAAQNMYKNDIDLAKNRMEQIQKEREFDQKLVDTYGQQYADLLKQQMVNNGDYLKAVIDYTKSVDVADINRSSNLGGNVITGEYGLGKQQVANAGDLAVAQTTGENQYRTQQLKGSQDYVQKQMELEHPTTVIPKMSQAYSDFSFGQAMNPNAGTSFFGALPTNYTNTYLPNINQLNTANAPIQNVNPTSKEALYSRMLYGNMGR